MGGMVGEKLEQFSNSSSKGSVQNQRQITHDVYTANSRSIAKTKSVFVVTSKRNDYTSLANHLALTRRE